MYQVEIKIDGYRQTFTFDFDSELGARSFASSCWLIVGIGQVEVLVDGEYDT